MAKVLIAEDSLVIRKIIRNILEEVGFKIVAEVGNGLDAITKTRVFKPDLIVMDVVMPKMNGRELSEQLKSLVPNAKIMFVSGYTENTIVHEGELEQNINFLGKPYTFNNLLSKVRQILDKTTPQI